MIFNNIGTCVIVVDPEQKRVLLGKRMNSYKSGWYGLPGGRLEFEEGLVDGAKRELAEETGLIAEDLEYLGVVREKKEGYSFIHFVFLCNKYSGQLQVMEVDHCESWNWIPLESIPEKTLEGHRTAIDIFKEFQKGGYVDLLKD